MTVTSAVLILRDDATFVFHVNGLALRRDSLETAFEEVARIRNDKSASVRLISTPTVSWPKNGLLVEVTLPGWWKDATRKLMPPIPERCSRARRIGVQNHPEIAFGFAGILTLF